MSLLWMRWTWQSLVFFIILILSMVGMILWEKKYPSRWRKRVLPFPTTRGERLYLGLLLMAFFHFFWTLWTDSSSFVVSLFSFLLLMVIIRWG